MNLTIYKTIETVLCELATLIQFLQFINQFRRIGGSSKKKSCVNMKNG